MADEHTEALRASVARLHGLVIEMDEAELTRPAYPRKWSIADVLSHIGSGAVIMQRRLDDTLAGVDTPAEFAPGVWDAWNAKDPVAKRGDALAADAALLAGIDAVTSEQRRTFASAMGPMTLDFAAFVGMRLNEHALHTWDIEVVEKPAATISQSAAGLVVDNLELITRFTGKPTGETRTITVTTTQPARTFLIELTPASVILTPTTPTATSDIELPAEAFARLVYGRLDPEHTPSGNDEATLGTLRVVFPGP